MKVSRRVAIEDDHMFYAIILEDRKTGCYAM